ncbi:hypothetical protein AB4369_20790 [Vibrio sp. 10N.261.49.A5]|uniref:hypothetical protein n=1 Tax=Vibrio TaxID=662 RepID=UPI000F9A2C34|nr:hypothetical protein [Vibrio crassostreae]ROR87538.1 hypothetical protein EDB66_0470 [Vibrio crassostreae]TQL46069.1 hypothetical protein FB443_1011013 [Vibrio crassostreae]
MNTTVSMFEKGRAFVAAAALLKAYEGHMFVSAHLFCQGFECIGKAILLQNDYKHYSDLLRKKFGHDLVKLLDEIQRLYGNDLFCAKSVSEVNSLNELYKAHELRYGSSIDFKGADVQISFDSLHHDLISILNRSEELVGS